jgi:WD40 repeat protein
VSSGTERRRFPAPRGDICGIAFSSDGKTLALGGNDKTVRLWEVEGGKETGRFEASGDRVCFLAFSPDGLRLAAGSSMGVRVWDLKANKELPRPQAEISRVLALAFSPDGKNLVFAGIPNGNSADDAFHTCDVGSGKELARFGGSIFHGVPSLTFSPDAKILATGGDNIIRLWNGTTGQEALPFAGHTSEVYMLIFSPDGKAVLSGSFADSTIHLWDPNTGRESHLLALPVNQRLYSPAVTMDGKKLAAGCSQDIVLWDLSKGMEVGRIKQPASSAVDRLVFSPDGQKLAFADSGGHEIRVFDVATAKEVLRLPAHERMLWSIKYSPDGKTLASVGWDMRLQTEIRLWDSATGKELRQWHPVDKFPGAQPSLVFAGARTLALWRYLGPTCLWNTSTGKEFGQFGDSVLLTADFSPDGKLMASWDNNNPLPHIRVWEVATGTEIGRFQTGRQWGVCFLP